MSDDDKNVIIIKKKKGGDHGHHGGAWKIAYADFVTAMMAFFLLMWLLNSTSEEQKRGIADFFSPISVFESDARTGGKMGSKSVTVEGAFDGRSKPNKEVATRPGAPIAEERNKMPIDRSASAEERPIAEQTLSGAQLGENSSIIDKSLESSQSPSSIIENQFDPLFQQEVRSKENPETYVQENEGNSEDNLQKVEADDLGQTTVEDLGEQDPQNLTEAQKQELQEEKELRELQEKMTEEQIVQEYKKIEDKLFEQAEQQLREAIEKNGLADLSENLVIEQTEEGLRIQLIDKENRPLFPSGSAKMHDHTVQLMREVSNVILKVNKQVAIHGHTDAKPYPHSKRYSNWELSADRANSSRKMMKYFNVPETQISQIVGHAARDPYIKDNPLDPQNRRISIVLLRDKKENIIKQHQEKMEQKRKEEESLGELLGEDFSDFEQIPESEQKKASETEAEAAQ